MSNNYTLPRLICDEMQLALVRFSSGQGGKWQWEIKKNGNSTDKKEAEAEKQNLSFVEETDTSRSVAFSLDMNDSSVDKRFPFFPKDRKKLAKVARTYGMRGKMHPLRGVAAICDIIVLTIKDNSLRAFVIEVKSSPSGKTQASIQIANGAFFCKWLHHLLNKHCGIPGRLEIVQIISLAGGGVLEKPGTAPASDDDPNPLPEIKTLEYNSNVKTIRLQNAYKFCKDHKFLKVNTIPPAK